MKTDKKVPFKGNVFVVTSFSVYCMSLEDPGITPVVRKMQFAGKSPAKVPVGGTLRTRVYWGITSKGLVPYRVKGKQKNPAEHVGPIPSVESLSRRHVGQPTAAIVGLFFKQSDAEECLSRVVKESPASESFADEQYYGSTVAVLRAIQTFPLVTFSREGKYALPAALLQMFDSEY